MIGQWCETCGEMTLPRESDNRCLWCMQVVSEPEWANITNPETRAVRVRRDGASRSDGSDAGPLARATSGEPSGSLTAPYQANHPWRARRAARLGT